MSGRTSLPFSSKASRWISASGALLAGVALAAPANAQHWAYAGAEGPAKWGEHAPTCSLGKAQSPVEIATKGKSAAAPKGPPAPLHFAWHKAQGTVVNNGHTIQVNLSAGSSLEVGGIAYDLLQFHFHSPSEHVMDGKPSPMEVHFVHKTSTGKLGVVGMMMTKEKTANGALAGVFTDLPAKADDKRQVEIDLAALLPENHSYFTYEGSLTTPPCSEGVHWMVLKQPLRISAAQIKSFRKLFPLNARPVQALNTRQVALQAE
jgi:carbonic anhydrase